MFELYAAIARRAIVCRAAEPYEAVVRVPGHKLFGVSLGVARQMYESCKPVQTEFD
jgi:hypothetical protein